MRRLKAEKSPSSQECNQKIAELVYCLMYQHAGYPDLYEHVLEALKVTKGHKVVRVKVRFALKCFIHPMFETLQTRQFGQSEAPRSHLKS